MKISKVRQDRNVGNTRAAIVLKEDAQEGILYNDPARKGSAVRDEQMQDVYIKQIIKNAKRSYGVFNKVKLDQQLAEAVKENRNYIKSVSIIANSVDDCVRRGIPKIEGNRDFPANPEDIARNKRYTAYAAKSLECRRSKGTKPDPLKGDDYFCEKNFVQTYRKKAAMDVLPVKNESVIDMAVTQYLKKSLSRDYVRKALKKMIMDAYQIPSATAMPKDISIQRDFIDAVLEDIYRVRVQKQAYTSIKNQNMPVQPQRDGEEAVFGMTVSGQKNKQKSGEQKAFNLFLSDYANLNAAVRADMRIRLRRLLVLYFYGENEARRVDCAGSEWKDHAERGDVEAYFIPAAQWDKSKNKAENKTRQEENKAEFRSKNIECYRKAMAVIEKEDAGEFYFADTDLNRFFIHRIESSVEKLYDHIRGNQDFKFRLGYISEKVWKDLINYLSVKYIAIGKAVYQYAMEGLNKAGVGDLKMGEITPEYIAGISSFDYELIKAEETFQRETAVYVTFADRHMTNATLVEGHDLFDDEISKNLSDCLKGDVLRNILQFFGGKSKWEDFDFTEYGGEQELFKGLRNALYSLRNESFHFVTENKDTTDRYKALIGAMFERESDRIAEIYRDKFYDNNLHLFYEDSDLERLLKKLYSGTVERNSQVPAFNNVFIRKHFVGYLENELRIDMKRLTKDEQLKFSNALYYMFKEMYYNLFLADRNVLDSFVKTTQIITADKMDKSNNDYFAEQDFAGRIMMLKNAEEKYSLAEICQLIMTEYNQQNSGNMKRKSADRSARDKNGYSHFKMLLYKNLKDTFTKYVNNNYPFIKAYKLRTAFLGKEDFLPGFAGAVKPYGAVAAKVKDSAELQKWYVLGRLLTPKQANQLLGSLHSYRQYVWNVKRRSTETECPLRNVNLYNAIGGENLSDIDAVLDICVKLSGTVSNQWDDYFEDKEAYAAYIAQYVNYKATDFQALSDFCERGVQTGEKLGLYADAGNPIPERNIILSKLFGENRILSEVVKKVDYNTILYYYGTKNKIKDYQTNSSFDEKQQTEIKKFQEYRNRVQLKDLVDYGDLLNELQGQLINWCYLRERDLMYFQLGFHYLCVNNQSAKPAGYKTLTVKGKDGNSTRIENVILSQICALYINGIPLYYPNSKREGEWKILKGKVMTGTKIRSFVNEYTQSFQNECDYYSDEQMCYTAGLELFENLQEHDNITVLRNAIDHFHYFAGTYQGSILSMYSEVFDRFFSYDSKYRKNVPNILYNILLKYWVNAKFFFSEGEKEIGKDDNVITKKRADIRIVKEGIESEKFTYKIKESGVDYEKEFAARNREYLETVVRILNYPDKINEKELVKEVKLKDKKAITKGSIKKDTNNAKKGAYNPNGKWKK